MSACSTTSGLRLAPPPCDWPAAFELPDGVAVVDAPLIDRPLGNPSYVDLGAAIKAGNAETRAYNQTVVNGLREANELNKGAVSAHNEATVALEAECASRLSEWLEG
jgi:hypothetical protein